MKLHRETGFVTDHVTLSVTNNIAEVQFNRPDKLNALNAAMFDALLAVGAQLQQMQKIRAVILSGIGKVFCAGLDIELLRQMLSVGESDPNEAQWLAKKLLPRTHGSANIFQHVVLMWRQLPMPVIAAVHGVAFGAGFQLMLGADIRYVDPTAQLSVMETQWGLVPDMAGTLLMRQLARDDIVRELTFSGRVFLGAEAMQMGFATALHEQPYEAAHRLALQIAARSPDAMRAAKRLLNAAGEVDAATLLAAESREQQLLMGSPNQVEAVRANLEKRAPLFRDPPLR
jgi:enoyl-CoA hydratase/carnithine racemase